MNGERLKNLRILNGHTQESLAEILGVDNRQIWRWETGKTTPSGDNVASLAQALNTTADYLLGLTDDPRPPRNEGLSERERDIINAVRRGDKLEAIKAIVSG